MKAKHAFQSRGQTSENWVCATVSELFPYHEEESEEACIYGTSIGKIDRDLLLGRYCVSEDGNDLVNMPGGSRTREAHSDGFRIIRLRDDQIFSMTLISQPQPPGPNGKRQDVSEQQA